LSLIYGPLISFLLLVIWVLAAGAPTIQNTKCLLCSMKFNTAAGIYALMQVIDCYHSHAQTPTQTVAIAHDASDFTDKKVFFR